MCMQNDLFRPLLQPVRMIRDFPDDDQPLNKLMRSGAASLTDAELLSILIRTGNRSTGENALDLARSLLTWFGGLAKIPGREWAELKAVPGIGKAKAAALVVAFELSKRIESGTQERVNFSSSTDVAQYFIPRMRDLKKEQFVVLLLDARNRLIKSVIVSEGSLTASIVHPREIYRPAILESAASVIFLHNHPSGDPTPSEDDLRITTQLVEAGRFLDIRVLDHIVLGHSTFTSLAGKGLI